MDSFKYKLLKGSRAKIQIDEDLFFHPPTLEKIFDYEGGYDKFMSDLGIFFADLSDLKKQVDDEKMKDMDGFQIFLLMLSGEDEKSKKTRNKVRAFLEFFTKKEWFHEKVVFHTEKNILDDELWDKLKELIAMEFGVKIEKEKDYNFANDKAKQFKERRKAIEEEVAKAKAKEGDGSDFFDLISGVATRSNALNILNIWDLTMFQFLQELQRLNMIENYDYNLKALLAGADSKKIKVQHWTNKI